MALVTGLIVFGVTQVMETQGVKSAQLTIDWIRGRFHDPSKALPKALAKANERAWQSLAIALAGDGFLGKIQVLMSDGTDKAIRQQVKQFLDSTAAVYGAIPTDFRKTCLAELKEARKKRSLDAANISENDLARQVSEFQRFSAPTNLQDSACMAVAQVADELTSDYPNLARLLREPTPAGPPLLVSAFAYFFRREVEKDDELSNGLMFDGLRQLAASQAKDFLEIGKACNAIGSRFDEVLGQLDRIETVVGETHGAVLDMQGELQRLGGLHLNAVQEIKNLNQLVTKLLEHAGVPGEVDSEDSFSIRSEDESRAVKELLVRFRQLPRDQQKQVPALLNGLGKLQIGTGDFEGAKNSFTEVAEAVVDKEAKAEAQLNLYHAALMADLESLVRQQADRWEICHRTHDELGFIPKPWLDIFPAIGTKKPDARMWVRAGFWCGSNRSRLWCYGYPTSNVALRRQVLERLTKDPKEFGFKTRRRVFTDTWTKLSSEAFFRWTEGEKPDKDAVLAAAAKALDVMWDRLQTTIEPLRTIFASASMPAPRTR